MRYDIRLTISTKFAAIKIFMIVVQFLVMQRQLKSVAVLVTTIVNNKPAAIIGIHLIKVEVCLVRACSYCVVFKSL